MRNVWVDKSLRVFVMLACAGAILCCGRAPAKREPAPVAAKSGPGLDFRAIVYSGAFAKRFGVPAQGIEQLDPGLQAVALRISDSPETGALCAVDLYLDDSVDFDYPEGSQRRADDIRAHGRPNALGLFYQVNKDETTRDEMTRWWQEPRGMFRTKNAFGAVGEFQSLALESYYRSFVPELSIATFEVICTVLLGVEGGSVEVWLLRRGQDAEGLNPTSVDDSVARKLVLPARLLKHAAPATIAASKLQADPTHLPIESAARAGAYSIPN